MQTKQDTVFDRMTRKKKNYGNFFFRIISRMPKMALKSPETDFTRIKLKINIIKLL